MKSWLLFIAAIFASPLAFAQSYPTQPVKILVGFPPGGTTDVMGRLTAQELASQTGKTFLVENRPVFLEFLAVIGDDGYHRSIQQACTVELVEQTAEPCVHAGNLRVIERPGVIDVCLAERSRLGAPVGRPDGLQDLAGRRETGAGRGKRLGELPAKVRRRSIGGMDVVGVNEEEERAPAPSPQRSVSLGRPASRPLRLPCRTFRPRSLRSCDRGAPAAPPNRARTSF